MKPFLVNLKSFSITHLFLGLFLLFGVNIFTHVDETETSKVYEYILVFCFIATLIQAVFFTLADRFADLAGVAYFITALVLELIIANTLFLLYLNPIDLDGNIGGSLILNASIVAALVIMMLIKEYQVQNPDV